MTIDKSSEASAKAALLKLKNEEQVCHCTMHELFIILSFSTLNSDHLDEQEVERRVRKQFKGLFDKRPGEIAEAGTNEGEDDAATGENLEKDDLDNLDDHEERTRQTTAPPPAPGILSQLRKLFASVGLNRCTIL